MCLYPRLIRNKKYTANKKNGGIIPAILDNRVLQVPVGCGKCMECRKQKAREWQVRLLEDVRHNKNGKFITLTFSDESIYKLTQNLREKGYRGQGYELDNAIATIAVRRFSERWRRKFKKSVRRWLITELGHNGTENIHLHGIIWTDESVDVIRERWEYGWIYPRKETTEKNYVNEQTVNYLTKYVTKQDLDHRLYKPKILTSGGMGAGYMDREDSNRHKFKGKDTKQTYVTRTGHEVSLPIYWRNKVWTDDEREQLWLDTLDKNERWVMGEKVDVSETDADYFGVLEHYRKINDRLGFGNSEKDWDRKRYEEELRKIKQGERMAKGAVKSNRKPSRGGGLGKDNSRL